jgi:intermediate peptidase
MQSQGPIAPWNYPFLVERARQQLGGRSSEDMAKYFSVSNCLNGLSLLFKRLYGIQMVDTGPPPEERLWHPSVKKFTVTEETGEVLGHLYCDLFTRRGKVSPVGLFTVQGSRHCDPEHIQKPVVVLSTNYSTQELTHSEVVDLFHEMGHAMHSMLAQTNYQSTSGTRCTMDFVEIPSTIMERFAWDYRVLKTFAFNQYGEILPEVLLEVAIHERRMFSGLALQQKILQASVDQVYHSTDYERLGGTSEAWRRTQEELGCSIPYVPNTSPELHFEHLECYGGTYYTYLWCDALAGHIYDVLFREDPFSRQAGDRFRERLLAHGGGQNPWHLVVDTLGYQPSLVDLVDSVFRSLMDAKRVGFVNYTDAANNAKSNKEDDDGWSLTSRGGSFTSSDASASPPATFGSQ